MKLHENRELFADAVTITAQQMKLPEIYAEKDYWVALALQRIFTKPLAEFMAFKHSLLIWLLFIKDSKRYDTINDCLELDPRSYLRIKF